eukprot:m.1485476 g.1485476  ORF g.1485476 m.1485476 type:complete len:66 (-) comp25182_c0_seq6:4715-4912(-)
MHGLTRVGVLQLSAKLDLFASTTSDLMRKNAELEVQLNAMRVQMENTSGSRNRFQVCPRAQGCKL